MDLVSYVEHRNDDRRSSLSLAAQENHLEVVTFLIENNADVNPLDKDRVNKFSDYRCFHILSIMTW